MKKTVSVVLTVVLTAALLCTAVFAGEAELSHGRLKTFMKAADALCDLYRVYDYGDYSDEIFDLVAEMYPETVMDSYEGQPVCLLASEEQVTAAAKAKWDYLSDKTLEEFFFSGLRFYCLTEDGRYELETHAHGGGLPGSFSAKGILCGYTVDDNGVCRLYYSTRYAKETANEYLGSHADAFWEEVVKLDYPAEIKYDHGTFVESQGDYYHIVQDCRAFEFKLSTDGLAEYVTDEYITGFPVSMTYIAGDINGDGEVDNKDVVTLFKYLSGVDLHVNSVMLDTNGDTETDNKDIVQLFKFCSGDKTITLNDTPSFKG